VTHEKKARLIAAIGSRVARALIRTLRFQIDDRAGVVGKANERPLIWAFWHNRLFVVPYIAEHFLPQYHGFALTSASKDGEILAAYLKCFGVGAVRGSSSRGGARALVEMKRLMDRGTSTAITPDGPRGPRYHFNPGLIKLAQITGCPIMPIHISYSRFWQLKSWDGFMIPRPFASVAVIFDQLLEVPQTNGDAEFEVQRARIESALRSSGATEIARVTTDPGRV
jgi:lysophospholipid acyltransferase (LPLAT)-like uncharacterized protein